jgi:hypothetical protein
MSEDARAVFERMRARPSEDTLAIADLMVNVRLEIVADITTMAVQANDAKTPRDFAALADELRSEARGIYAWLKRIAKKPSGAVSH